MSGVVSMAENTKYYVVLAQHIEEARAQLCRHQIISCIYDKELRAAGWGQPGYGPVWVPVVVNLEMKWTAEGKYFLDDHWEAMTRCFERVASIFVEDDWQTWRLIAAWAGTNLTRKFHKHGTEPFNRDETHALETFFQRPAQALLPTLAWGRVKDFCACVGVPYLHLVVHNKFAPTLLDYARRSGGCVLASQLPA